MSSTSGGKGLFFSSIMNRTQSTLKNDSSGLKTALGMGGASMKSVAVVKGASKSIERMKKGTQEHMITEQLKN